MPKIENVDQAKAVALYEIRKVHPYGIKAKINVQKMTDLWIVRLSWGNPVKEVEYRIDANTGQAWRIK